MSLIYLLSSLPMLSFDSAPPLSKEAFLQSCREWLRKKDADAVEALLYESSSTHPFVMEWIDKETILRNALVFERARKLGADASLWVRYAHGCDKKIESDVEDAIHHHNPLQMARAIDEIRWEIADELQGADPLSIKAIFTYAIQLAILTRWSERNSKAGHQTFGELTEVPITL